MSFYCLHCVNTITLTFVNLFFIYFFKKEKIVLFNENSASRSCELWISSKRNRQYHIQKKKIRQKQQHLKHFTKKYNRKEMTWNVNSWDVNS